MNLSIFKLSLSNKYKQSRTTIQLDRTYGRFILGLKINWQPFFKTTHTKVKAIWVNIGFGLWTITVHRVIIKHTELHCCIKKCRSKCKSRLKVVKEK